MKKKIDLVNEDIFKTLFKLSLPILGTSFIQMAYSMVDMIWVGKIGSGALAAIGTAGFFSWFGSSLVLVTKTGAEVGVSQSIGKGNDKEKNKYIYNSLYGCITLSIIYTILLIVFNKQLIGFFNLGDKEIIKMSIDYLIIISIGMVSTFLNPQFTGIMTATGNSKSPFIINTIGLVLNLILDPILIFGIDGIKPLGVVGAALATVISQVIVTAIFICIFIRYGIRINLKNIKFIDSDIMKKIIKWGTPTALQNCLFSVFGMIIGRMIATFGPTPIAVQKVGSQIESLSWMTAGGFSSALTAFIGQNYGAGRSDRVIEGYKKTLMMSSILGILATVLLVFFGQPLFKIFSSEQEVIKQGGEYLKILGYSQIFMCIEITTAGAYFGLGRTLAPSLISIIFTGLRIPAAMILSNSNLLGLNGVWWSISMSSVFKGVILISMFIFIVVIPMRRKYNKIVVSKVGRVN